MSEQHPMMGVGGAVGETAGRTLSAVRPRRAAVCVAACALALSLVPALPGMARADGPAEGGAAQENAAVLNAPAIEGLTVDEGTDGATDGDGTETPDTAAPTAADGTETDEGDVPDGSTVPADETEGAGGDELDGAGSGDAGQTDGTAAPSVPAGSTGTGTEGSETPGDAAEDATYTPLTIDDVSSIFTSTVALTGRDALPGEQFWYSAMYPDMDGVDATDLDFVTSVWGLEDGVAKDMTFHGSLTFTAPGDYTFNVDLLMPDSMRSPGVAYDEHVGTVTFHVTAQDDGTLAYTTETNSLAFVNSYEAVMGETPVTVDGTVSVANRADSAPLEGESFTFAISGPGVADGTVVKSSGSDFNFSLYLSHSADSPVFSSAAAVDEDGGRTEAVKYTVTQVESGQTADVWLTLYDDGQGTITCTNVEYPQGGLDFEVTSRAVATFDGTVTLDGRAAAAGEFLFEVRETLEGETRVVTEGRNYEAAAGEAAAIDFNAVAYDEPGVYDYTVVQVPGDAANTTYDDAAFTAHVEVYVNDEGKLVADVTYPDGAVAFENTYTAPSDDGDQGGQTGGTTTGTDKPASGANASAGKQLAKTGDETDLAGAAAAAAVGAGVVLAGGGILLKRRTSR